MASPIKTEPVAARVPASTAAPKKPRKNPARRKAERANTNTEPSKETQTPKQASIPAPAKISRQASAPSVLNDVATTRPMPQSRKSTSTTITTTTTTTTTTKTPKPTTTPSQPQQTNFTTTRPPNRRSNTTSSSLSFNAPALVTGGLIGCAAGAAILMAVHVWYDFAGVKAAIATARAARLCVDNLSDELITSLSTGTYSTDEALDMLRRTTLAYASTIPDGAPVVERVFREIEAVRLSRGKEVDGVLQAAYAELRAAGDKGMGAVETRDVVLRHLLRLSLFASRATQDVLTRNPRLKPYRDGAVKALKEPPREKVPTSKVNLVMKHKGAVPA